MHDTFKVVTEKAEHIRMVNRTMILNLSLHLHLILRLFETAWAQDLEHDLLTALVPVLGEVDLGVGALINLLLNFESCVNHHSLGLDHWSRVDYNRSFGSLVENLTVLRDGRKLALVTTVLGSASSRALKAADGGVDGFLRD